MYDNVVCNKRRMNEMNKIMTMTEPKRELFCHRAHRAHREKKE